MDWGFDFKWSNKKIINARAETIFEKKTFKNLARSKRCIIPASAYFEWQKKDDQKIKYKIFDHSESILSLAGLYHIRFDDENNKMYQFTILTKEAEEGIRNIHNRMPVIIEKDNTEEWLFSEKIDQLRLNDIINNQKLSFEAKIQ